MGILNVTPDSFSDGGIFSSVSAAILHAKRMIDEGAHIIDVGGESTRPRAQPVPAEEEIRRVVPVIERLAAETSCAISIDTSKPEVMRAAVAAGAGLINDVRALQLPGALSAAASLDVPVCLMHMQGEPATMQDRPAYTDVVAEVMGFLRERMAAAVGAGIPSHRIVVDPGFGFGKDLEHNLVLLRRLRELGALDCPVLVGLSRKSIIGKLLGRSVSERLPASIAFAMLALQEGAQMVRVHDVRATCDAVQVYEAVHGIGMLQ